VGFDGFHTYVKLLSNLFSSPALSEELEHLAFSVGQYRESRAIRIGDALCLVVDHSVGYHGTEVGLPAGDGTDCLDQFLGGAVLQ